MPSDKRDECGSEIAGKKTSNLKTHIKSRHPEVFTAIEETDKETAAMSELKKRKHSAIEGNVR